MNKLVVFLLFGVIFFSGCGHQDSKVTELSIWHPWGGPQKERFDKVISEFNKAHKNLRVRAVYTPNDLSSNQKFFTSVAASRPPDIIFVDGPQTAAWAEQGAIVPLDNYLKREGITADDYYLPCWEQNHYKDKVWALTYCADPNFALVWNKKIFRQVGLDPERPPQTIKELDEYNDRITKVDKKTGKIIRLGIIPWAQFGSANSLYSWGWAFGGSFYNPETQKVTANDPKIVEAMEWMVSYTKKYDITKIASFASGFGSKEQNPFYIGLVAMQLLHISNIEEIADYAPNLDFGIGYVPAPSTGEKHSSWIGGWCLGIPRGSKHPEGAWEFIRWMCADKEGTRIAGKIQGVFPGYKPSNYFKTMSKEGYYGHMLEILEQCKHQRPVMPAQEFYMGSLNRAVDYSIYASKTPKQALDDVTKESQAELDLRLAGDNDKGGSK